MKLTKFTHSCVRLQKDGQVLVIDPGTFSEAEEALAGAQAGLVASPKGWGASTGSNVSTVGVETRAMISAVSVSASTTASIGAPEAKGTKPLWSGPKMDEVRNMRSFFFVGFRGVIVSRRRRILDKSPAVRATPCVR